MAIVVVVIAGPAPYLRCLPVHQGNDGMVRDTTTFDAVIVDDISESLFIHSVSR